MQIYISENKEIYFTGQKLKYYDTELIIEKFIIHKRRRTKEKYLCINLKDTKYKTVKYTVSVDNLKYYKKLGE